MQEPLSLRSVLCLAAALLLGSGCHTAGAAGYRALVSANASSAPGLDLDGMDRSVAPGDDFFAQANGAWIRMAEIPPDRAPKSSGVIMTELTGR